MEHQKKWSIISPEADTSLKMGNEYGNEDEYDQENQYGD